MTDHHHNTRYAIDIRVFLAVIVTAMAISFGVGVGLGQSNESLMASMKDQLPKVTSVEMMASAPTSSGDLHEPAGQHLLVDIKGIESAFLDSEERLSQAMVETVRTAGLTLLSYHCHKLLPKGVSCVGVLLESHISFHTWPDEGVITLDLFTCGNNPLIPVVDTLRDLFGIGEDIYMQWSHELRGFRNHNQKAKKDNGNYAILDHASDLATMVWSPIEMVVKTPIVSTLTKYQRVDIWDLVGLEDTPTYEDAIKANLQPGDPRWTTPEVVTPGRHLFLDGRFQSDRSSDVAFHEALVHPAMFAHANPTRVAIVGGAEGATVREVLKHKTATDIVMIEIDQELMDITAEHMPFMSNCTDLLDRADQCLKDERVTIVVEDAKHYFVQNHGKLATDKEAQPKFDVVIVDAHAPEYPVSPISSGLYDQHDVLQAFMDSLSDEGVLSIQIGSAPTLLDPRADIGFHAPREALFVALEALDSVQAMFVYEDPNCGHDVPLAFLIACKSVTCRKRFFATADETDYFIYDRIVRTHSKARALQYFDGVTHLNYQVAPKAWETLYCRREPTPFECAYRHLDFRQEIFEFVDEDDAKEQGIVNPFVITADYTDDAQTEIEATHVLANVDIPKGSYIMPEHLASSLQLSHQSIANLKENVQYGGVTIIEDFLEFVKDFGHDSKAAGSARRLVEIGATYFIAETEDEAEANVGRWMPAHPDGKRPKYSPVYERHKLSFDVFMVATKDIAKGTELKRYAGMWDQE